MWASMSVGESGLPTAGATVSHYRVLSALGVGGMGAVYLAEDLKLKRKVALKFLKKTGDAHSVSRLLREAETASALDHPNIATIYEIGEWNGQPFIAMAFVPGENLLQRLRRGPMTIDEIAGVGAQIASRAGCGTRGRHRPPRLETRQRHADTDGAGQDPGLRPGPQRVAGFRHDDETHDRADDRRNARVHGPRTAQQRGCGSARRCLGLRDRALRDAGGSLRRRRPCSC